MLRETQERGQLIKSGVYNISSSGRSASDGEIGPKGSEDDFTDDIQGITDGSRGADDNGLDVGLANRFSQAPTLAFLVEKASELWKWKWVIFLFLPICGLLCWQRLPTSDRFQNSNVQLSWLRPRLPNCDVRQSVGPFDLPARSDAGSWVDSTHEASNGLEAQLRSIEQQIYVAAAKMQEDVLPEIACLLAKTSLTTTNLPKAQELQFRRLLNTLKHHLEAMDTYLGDYLFFMDTLIPVHRAKTNKVDPVFRSVDTTNHKHERHDSGLHNLADPAMLQDTRNIDLQESYAPTNTYEVQRSSMRKVKAQVEFWQANLKDERKTW